MFFTFPTHVAFHMIGFRATGAASSRTQAASGHLQQLTLPLNLSNFLFCFTIATEIAEVGACSGPGSPREQEIDRRPFQMPVRLKAAEQGYIF